MMQGASRKYGESPVYSDKRVCAALGIPNYRLSQLRTRRLLPFYETEVGFRYDGLRVDYLAAKARVAAGHGFRGWDVALAELCELLCQYESCRPGVSEEVLSRHRAKVKNKCKALVADGRVVTITTLINKLAGFVVRKTIHNWASQGLIATIKIGRTHYMSEQYCSVFVRLITEHFTLQMAADELGYTYSALWAWVRQGKVNVLRGPDNVLRISPTRLAVLRRADALRKSRENLTQTEAAELIGVAPGALQKGIPAGRVGSVWFSSTQRIPLAEVERLRAVRTTLNTGFEWLDAQVTSRGRPVRTYTSHTVCTRLRVSPPTLSAWSKENLLPFYVISLSREGGSARRDFVAMYVYGLLRFAGGGKVSSRLVREYCRKCAKAQIIL